MFSARSVVGVLTELSSGEEKRDFPRKDDEPEGVFLALAEADNIDSPFILILLGGERSCLLPNSLFGRRNLRYERNIK